MTKILKRLDLDLKDIPRNKRKEAKRDALDFLENEIQRHVSRGKSPVHGEGSFKTLNPKYSKDEKQGNSIANLQLEGDLMEALELNDKTGATIEVGYSSKNPEIEKADGHNQFSADAKKPTWGTGKNKRKALPKRRYIPESSQSFKKSIMNGIDKILNEHRVDPEVQRQNRVTITRVEDTPEETRVETQSNLFDEENIIDLLRREFERTL